MGSEGHDSRVLSEFISHLFRRNQQHSYSHAQQNAPQASAATGIFLVTGELLSVLLTAPSGMAFGTIELPEAIPPRLDRPRVMPKRPSASTAPICLARRLPERPLQPPNQQEDNHHDRPHRQIDQSVIGVEHRLFPFAVKSSDLSDATHAYSLAFQHPSFGNNIPKSRCLHKSCARRRFGCQMLPNVRNDNLGRFRIIFKIDSHSS